MWIFLPKTLLAIYQNKIKVLDKKYQIPCLIMKIDKLN